MRIAAHRSTTTDSANRPEANAKPATASFLEVLAGTSAQSSPVNSAAISSNNQQAGSETADEKQQGFDHAARNQPRTESDASQTTLTPTSASTSASSAAVKPDASQPQSRANAAGRSTARDEKPSPSQPASIATMVPLPAIVSAQTAPLPVTPVPSSSSTGPCAGSNEAQASQPATTLPQAVDDHISRNAHVSAAIPDKLAAPDADTANEPAHPANDLSIQASPSGNRTSGPDANSTDASSTASASTTPASQSTASAAAAQSSAILSTIASMPGLSTQPISNAATGNKAADQNQLKGVATNNTTTAAGNGQSSTSGTSHAAQDSGQGAASAQHTQNQAATQTAPAGQAQADAAAPQMQAVAVHAAAHDATAPHSHADGAAETPRAAAQTAPADSHDTAATQAINTASVIQKMSETEMRVGMHSAEFGEISIRTSVSQQQMVAQISVDHGELGKAISAHIPGMEAKLGNELGLRALVQVSQGGMSFSGERGYSPQRERSSYAQPAQIDAASGSIEADSSVLRLAAGSVDGYRLDIRA